MGFLPTLPSEQFLDDQKKAKEAVEKQAKELAEQAQQINPQIASETTSSTMSFRIK
jgi:hypothetical protein